MRIQRMLAAVTLGAVIVTMLGDVQAHHAIVGYDRQKPPATLEGVVKQFGWRNPHPYIVWEMKQSDGTAVSWTGELPGPIVMMSRAGMTRNSVRAGDTVVMTGWTSLRGTPNMLVQKVVVKSAEGQTAQFSLEGV